MAADRAQQSPQKPTDVQALWPLGQTKHGGDVAALAIGPDDRLEAIFVMVGIEPAQLLATMHGVKYTSDTGYITLGHSGEAIAIQIEHSPDYVQQRTRLGQVFQARDWRLRTQRMFVWGQIEGHLEHWIGTRAGSVIVALVIRYNHRQPKTDNIGMAVRDTLGTARILDAGCQNIGHPKTLLDFTQ